MTILQSVIKTLHGCGGGQGVVGGSRDGQKHAGGPCGGYRVLSPTQSRGTQVLDKKKKKT